MNSQNLPLVPFGKYKNKPITRLIEDVDYLEWCKKQKWFQKYPIVYNICVNQTINTKNEDSRTPEHNRLQNMFLDTKNQLKLVNLLFGINNGKKFKRNFESMILDEDFIKNFDSSTFKIQEEPSFATQNDIAIGSNGWFVPEFDRKISGQSKIVFEDKYNWDLVLYFVDYQSVVFETKPDISNLIKDEKTLYDILKKYNFKYSSRDRICELDALIIKTKPNYKVEIEAVCKSIALLCELKPVLSDDYPRVLRKMKTQIELTQKKGHGFCDDFLKYYVLIIGSFESSSTSKEQLIEIFKQSNIRVIFTEKIFGCLRNKNLIETDMNKPFHKQDIEEENKLLKERVKILEQELSSFIILINELSSKNKILEQELSSKNNKSKTLKDYFNTK